jgi:hypothetical protein
MMASAGQYVRAKELQIYLRLSGAQISVVYQNKDVYG